MHYKDIASYSKEAIASYAPNVVHAHQSSIETMLWCTSAGDISMFYVLAY